MGTSEIYRAVASVPEVTDAPSSSTSRARAPRAGCRCSSSRDGVELSDDLRAELARQIRERCSPRHVPDEVYAIAEVPRTLSGKVPRCP